MATSDRTDFTPPEEWKEFYLGDAVYVSFDGYMLELRTGDGNNQVIYLEPSVYFALINYVDRLSNAQINVKVVSHDDTE